MTKQIRMRAAVAPLLGLALAACGGSDASERPTTIASAAEVPGEAAATPAEATDTQLPEGITPQMVSQGRTIYHGQGICFSCHGQEGAGTPLGPPLNDKEWLNLPTPSLEAIANVIRTGVPRPVKFPAPMAPNGGASLNNEQRNQVAAYVYSISHRN